ncbi:MAG: MFS transporter [Armatimonadetes bacterium]|nr:MFS transporter [Armatimonadota bacterium]
MRIFRHRDFAVLWTGALLSFFGSSIQTLAQGWFVYDLTGDKSKLALVMFFNFLPISLIGPFMGAVADMVDKRKALIACQLVFASTALFLGLATAFKFVTYEQILAMALINGVVQSIEMPTRQSIVGRVVPFDEMPKAVPIQAMTFNIARIAGPLVGGYLLSWYGVSFCYFANTFTYTALIFAVLAIRADLRAHTREPQPIKDLITEGARYTWGNKGLRVLFILEASVAAFGLQYVMLMPALARDLWHLDERGLGRVTGLIGVGAILGLLMVANIPKLTLRVQAIRTAITLMGVALITLGLTNVVWLSYAMVFVAGMCTLVQFNTTNTLFQVLSPPRLRGRVLAMHMWGLTGLSPFGSLFFGWLAQRSSIHVSLVSGGILVLVCSLFGWSQSRVLMATAQEHEADPSGGDEFVLAQGGAAGR